MTDSRVTPQAPADVRTCKCGCGIPVRVTWHRGHWPRPTVEEQIWKRVDKRADDECWEWTGYHDPFGYGAFDSDRVSTNRAHRLVYELVRGPIPDGLVLDHLCENKGCVNPKHLDPTTSVENLARSKRAKTHCKRGHELVGENLVVQPGGKRQCRTCRVLMERRRRAAKRSVA